MTPDSIYIKQVQSSSAYDYLSEIPVIAETDSGMEVSHQSADWLRRLLESDTAQVLAWVICGLIVLVLVWLVIKKFEIDDDKVKQAVGMGDDTIYGHDWVREIQQYMADGQYGEAVVLCYLRCLADMQQRGVIEFHLSKTPGMYLKEIENTSGDGTGRGRPSAQSVDAQPRPENTSDDGTGRGRPSAQSVDAQPRPENTSGDGTGRGRPSAQSVDAQPRPENTSDDGEPQEGIAGGVSLREVEKARVLTNQYLRVRYGHKVVDKATAERMIAL